MVGRLLVLLLLPMTALGAELSVHSDRQQVEMGKYVNAQIEYIGDASPGIADLQQWQDDFVVDRGDSEQQTLADGRTQITEQLRLYPRHTGEGLLESIALGGAIAAPMRIRVTPTIRNGIDGTPHWLPLPKQVWQGQTFEVGIAIVRLHPSNRIAVEEAHFPGFEVKPLPRTQQTREGTTQLTLRWQLTATGTGRAMLDPPAIEQRGRGRWRYYLAARTVEILPLPAYIPPTVPVGRPVLAGRRVEINTHPFWEVSVHSDVPLPDDIHGLRTQLASIADTDVDQVSVSRHRYRVAAPKWSWGLGPGPAISVPYFDPQAGRLITANQTLPAVWQVPRPAGYLILMMVAVTALSGLLALFRFTRTAWRQHRFRRAIIQARDPHTLRTLLLQASGSPSLQSWAKGETGGDARRLAADLNGLCFSPQPDIPAFEQLKHKIAQKGAQPIN